MAESVQLPEDVQRRLDALKAVGALGVCMIYGWFAIVKNVQVPVLVFLDVAVHEVGHKVFSPFGNLIMLIMGTGTQILFPLVVGIVFAIWKRDLIAWGIFTLYKPAAP
jgi:hypothetical protein